MLLLRLLEERLGIREPGEMTMADTEQIIAVVSGERLENWICIFVYVAFALWEI